MNRGLIPVLCLSSLVGCAHRADLSQVGALVQARLDPAPALAVPMPGQESGEDQRIAELLAAPIGPDQAAQLALLNNPRLRADLELLAIARGELIGAVLLPNPEFELELGYRSGEPLPSIELAATEDLGELLRMPVRIATAASELQAARSEAAARVLDLAFEARATCLRHAVAQGVLQMHDQVVEASSAAYDLASRMHAAGNINDLDLANEHILYQDARINRDRAELALFEAREALAVVLGLTGQEMGWEPSGTIEEPPDGDPDPVDATDRAIDNSLQLAVLDERYRAASHRAHLAVSEGLLPGIHAGVRAEREDGVWTVGPMLEATIPLFDHGEGAVTSARAEMRRVRYQAVDQAVRIRSAVRVTTREVGATRQRALQYRDVLLPLHEQVVAETLVRYNAMLVGVFQLLDAKRAEIAARARHLEAVLAYWLARGRLDQILAGSLPAAGGAEMSDDTPSARPSRGAGH